MTAAKPELLAPTHPAFINTPLQRGVAGCSTDETVSTVSPSHSPPRDTIPVTNPQRRYASARLVTHPSTQPLDFPHLKHMRFFSQLETSSSSSPVAPKRSAGGSSSSSSPATPPRRPALINTPLQHRVTYHRPTDLRQVPLINTPLQRGVANRPAKETVSTVSPSPWPCTSIPTPATDPSRRYALARLVTHPSTQPLDFPHLN